MTFPLLNCLPTGAGAASGRTRRAGAAAAARWPAALQGLALASPSRCSERRPGRLGVTCAASGGNMKIPAKEIYAEKGEKFLFQVGEAVDLYELPEGTRVLYPGVRADGERDEGKIRDMIREAVNNPIDMAPLREKLRELKKGKDSPKILFCFDDVSLPLPPMVSPDIRSLIMEECESVCIEEGVEDLEFICSIALHRYIRPDEMKHICGPRLFKKYFPDRMRNWNAVDEDEAVMIGTTRHGEDVVCCKAFAEADLVVYANVNYVSMDGGYKSYATGMIHYRSLKYNHDCKTLRETNSLYDPERSAMHRSFERMGRIMQKHTEVFHVETVLDENLFPWYLGWNMVLVRDQAPLTKALMLISVFSMRLLPLFVRKFIFQVLIRGQQGLLQVRAGETSAVHEQTLAMNYRDKVMEVDGQCDILILAPCCIGPYTKDMYFNPLLVNTYALGYYFNMYVGGSPLVREGGAVIVVNHMHYAWSEPAHTAYKELFEKVIKPSPGLDEFEAYQEEFATDDRLNDIYRAGLGPAGVHGFYMYTWAAHGMDKVGKVWVVGAKDSRGPEILRWDQSDSVVDAVEAAKKWMGKEDAKVTYWQSPPVGYVKVNP